MQETFVASNFGQTASGVLSIALTGADFTVLAGGAGDCVNGSTSLAGGASCTIRVRFTPTIRGPRQATLSVTAIPGGGATISLAGTGQ